MEKLNIVQVFISPKKFAHHLAKEAHIRFDALVLVSVLVFIYRGLMIQKLDRWILFRTILSIFLFALALQFVYWLGKGKIQFKLIFNLSTYIHLIVVVGSFFKEIPVLSILSLLSIQLLGIYYQYYIGLNIVRTKGRFIKVFCGIELAAVLISVNYQLLTYLGRYVVYSQRTQFFGLIVK